jgi:predicted ArsR family transcriptional regulator
VGEDRPETGRRLTIDQAADHLGISPDAVRSRVKRGTLASEREDGRVYVLVDVDRPRPAIDRPPTDQSTDNALTSQMQSEIDHLRGQLEAERAAHAEARRIIAGLVERIPAIEAPQESSGGAETVEEEPERGQPRPGRTEAQEGVQRPWWRRVFGQRS